MRARKEGRRDALALPPTGSHIVPLVIGDAAQTVRLSQRLWERGVWAPAIRPPTVPEGTSRLRVSVTALHTEEQIAALAVALREAGVAA